MDAIELALTRIIMMTLKPKDAHELQELTSHSFVFGNQFRDVQQKAFNLLVHEQITEDEYDAIRNWVRLAVKKFPKYASYSQSDLEVVVWAPGLKELAVSLQGLTHEERWEQLKEIVEKDKKRQNKIAQIQRKYEVEAALQRTKGNPAYRVVRDGNGGYKHASTKTAYTAAVNYLISQPPSQL
eukprot:2282618-Rhodomonas_salina.1